MAPRARQFAGYILLDTAHKNLLETVRVELVEAGNTALANDVGALRTLNILGRTVIKKSEAEKFQELLHRIYKEQKDVIKVYEKELKELDDAVSQSARNTSAALAQAVSLNKDLRKLDTKLTAALKKSKAALDAKP